MNDRILVVAIIVYSSFKIALSVEPNGQKRGFVSGDLIIGALLSIHENPKISPNSSGRCGNIREQYGMHRVEVLLKTIDEINENYEVLRGLKLGVDIRDTCGNSPIALEQSIDFIKNSISHRLLYEKSDSSKPLLDRDKAIVSLIGPSTSPVTLTVQTLMQLFNIPQVGFAATTIDLSDKSEYKTFLRVVPSDKLQAKALAQFIIHNNWLYLSLLNTKLAYGNKGMKEFKANIENTSICTDQEIEIDNNEPFDSFTVTVEKFFRHPSRRAKVIVCFCQGETVTKLLQTMKKLNATDHGFLIIGTDGWADRTEILGKVIDEESKKRDLSDTAVGAISIRLHSPKINDFDRYFQLKTSKNTPGNPWFEEFWETKFNCSLSPNNTKYDRNCTGKEHLPKSDQDSKLGFVVKSVWTVALGLSNFYKKKCKNASDFRECAQEKFFYVNGTNLLDEMKKITFMAYDNYTVKFDENGDPPGRYDIMNYQRNFGSIKGKFEYTYQKIGHWENDQLIVNDELIKWPIMSDGQKPKVISQCSNSCKVGEIKEYTKDKKCCWKCKKCSESQYVNKSGNEEKCEDCKLGDAPYFNRSGCYRIERSYIQWSDIASVIAVVFSCVGISMTTFITVVFIKHNDTPVVKSSSRELMYVIIAGIILSYLTTFALLSKPSIISCYLIRIMPGLSFSFIYGSLVTKTNRICRILATSKKKIIRHRGRFLTSTAQLVISLILILIEICIIIGMIFYEPPEVKEEFQNRNKPIVVCLMSSTALFVPMGFDAVLVCFCTWYAFKTRNLPENFNEAKFIGFTMYTTCIVWVSLVPIYIVGEFKVISLCFAINISATVAIVLLFIPKVYIILLRPEKNERSAFITTSDIRCHIGAPKATYQCSKDKSKPPKIKQKLQMEMETEYTYNCNNTKTTFSPSVDFGSIDVLKVKSCIHTQTDPILILDNIPSINKLSGDLSETQMALLQFLDENWNKEGISTQDPSNSGNSFPETIKKTPSEIDDGDFGTNLDDITETTPMKKSISDRNNSTLTYSPISNVSTDASSNISTMFIDYLRSYGRRFSKNKDNKTVKL